jgi:hypothetical protein
MVRREDLVERVHQCIMMRSGPERFRPCVEFLLGVQMRAPVDSRYG